MQRRAGRVGDDAVVVAVAFVDVEARQEPVAAADGAFDGLANSATVGGGQGELDRRKAQTLDLQKMLPKLAPMQLYWRGFESRERPSYL